MPVGRISRSLAQAERSRQGLVVAPAENPLYVGSQGFTPLSFDNLLWWGDANTVNKNMGDKVGILQDNYRKYHCINNTLSEQPILVNFAGRPWLSFDGVSSQRLRADFPSAPAGPNTLWVVCVKPATQASNGRVLTFVDNSNSIYWQSATQGYGCGIGGDNCSPSAGVVFGKPFVLIAQFNGAGDSFMRANGVQNNTFSPGGPNTTTVSCVVLGNDGSNANPCACLVGEAGAVGRKLNAVELAQLETYLRIKWAANF